MGGDRERRDSHYQRKAAEDAKKNEYNQPPRSMFPLDKDDERDTKAYHSSWINTHNQTKR